MITTTQSALLSRCASDFCREQPDETATATRSRATTLLAFLCISNCLDPAARSRFRQHSAHKESSQPQRGCVPMSALGRNPVGVVELTSIRTQGSLRQPWAAGRNAVGVPASSDIFWTPLRGHQRLIIRRLPEGDLKIAHPFKGGIVEAENRVPKGRLNSCHRDGNMNTRTTFAGFNRPFGTFPTANPNPAVNCRAIIKSPSGRGEA